MCLYRKYKAIIFVVNSLEKYIFIQTIMLKLIMKKTFLLQKTLDNIHYNVKIKLICRNFI